MKINATSCPPLKLSHQQLIRACMEVLESQNECKRSSRVENSKLFQSQNFANVWIVLKLKLSIFVSLIKHRRIFNSTAVRERRRDTYVKWCLNCLITVTMYDTMKRTVVIRWIIWSVRMYDITNWEFLVFIAYMHNYELISEREHAWEWIQKLYSDTEKQLNLLGILARDLVSSVDWLCLCRFVDESDPSISSVRPICPASNELPGGCVPVTKKIDRV